MGLSGRKAKQRIGKDPRNLSWADDASRFGQAYLAKFGWDASKGLGTSGEGRTSAIKATQKLDMLGIGMQHRNDPDGIAWRQNRDFENLLRRLNGEGTGTDAAPVGFHKACESKSLEEGEEGGGEEQAARETGDLEKVSDGDNDKGVITRKEEERKKKRKTTEEGSDKKERKKRKKSKDGHIHGRTAALDNDAAPPEAPPHESGSASMAAVTTPVPTPIPIRAPPRSHRARIIAAKRMAASNSTALAEILGIPSSNCPSSFSSTPTPTLTPAPVPNPSPALAAEPQDPLQKLTTSSQSVGDYFKAKLSAKAHGERQLRSTFAAATTGAGAAPRDDDDHRARLGLGGRTPLTESLDEEQVRGGIGASSSKFAAMFTLGLPTTDAGEGDTPAGVEPVVTHDTTDHDEVRRRKSEKKRAREERRRAKEERWRQKRAEAGQVDGPVGDVPVGEEATGRTKKKKPRRPTAPDGRPEGTHPSDAEAIPTKKRKKGDKDKRSAKHSRTEE